MKFRLLHVGFFALGLTFVLFASLSGLRTAAAVSFAVTSTADSGPGSLRQAILDANSNAGLDSISIAASGEIVLDSPLPVIDDDVVIKGPTSSHLTISGAYLYRIFDIASTTAVTISDLEIKEGRSPTSEDGGGIRSFGRLHLLRVNVHDNTSASSGGGVAAIEGTLILEASVVQSNTASSAAGVYIANEHASIMGSLIASNQGPGIAAYQGTTLFITGTQIISNSSAGLVAYSSNVNIQSVSVLTNFGGGIYTYVGSLDVIDSEIAGNRTTSSGAGINTLGTNTVLTDTIVVGNIAESRGGAIDVSAYDELFRIVGGEISLNSAQEGAGIFLAGGDLTVLGTRIISNTGSIGPAIYINSMRNAVVADSCIVNNRTPLYSDGAAVEVSRSSPYILAAPRNWWGAPDGPSGAGPGTGDSIKGQVMYNQFKITALPQCPTLSPELHINKTVWPDFATPGQAITYTVVLSNSGSGIASQVFLTDTLPTEIRLKEWVWSPPEGATATEDEVRWHGSILAGQSLQISFAVTNMGSYSRIVTNTVEFAHESQSGSAAVPIVLTTNPYFRYDPRPFVSTPTTSYEAGQKVQVTVSGVWPNACVPEPNNAAYLSDPDPAHELPIVINRTGNNAYVQVDLNELLTSSAEYQQAVYTGRADEWYAERCGTEPTPWSYTFASDSLPVGAYGTLVYLSWRPQNPLNQYQQWQCKPDHYCYTNTIDRTFLVGEQLFLPQVRR